MAIKLFDCVISGGGMVGAASAIALAQLGLTVALIEQNVVELTNTSSEYSLRVSAISKASEQLLQQLGAWQAIKDRRVCPYSRLGVWEQNNAYVEFNADSISQSHLGHIIENSIVQQSLWQELQHQPLITCFCPDSIESINTFNDKIETKLTSGITLSSQLLIGADGAQSKVRKMANIGVTGWNYQQSAMLIHVETEKEQQNITWQHFRETGPVAMLPLEGKQASLVWYHQRDEIKRLAQLSNSQLGQQIQQHFPEKLGQIKVIKKAPFPLTRQHANQYVKNRVLLLGDAAHSINPLAGQGVNLGFKDVLALQEVVSTAISQHENWSSPEVLARYQKARRFDNSLMMSAMDGFYFSFSHRSSLVKLVRNVALTAVNKIPKVKQEVLKYACGLK